MKRASVLLFFSTCAVCILIHKFEMLFTEDPRYNDSVCYQRFCCKIEFSVIKKLEMDPSNARMTDTFEQCFYESYVLCIC